MQNTRKNKLNRRRASGQLEMFAAELVIGTMSVIAFAFFLINSGVSGFYKEKLGFVCTQAAHYAAWYPGPQVQPATEQFVSDLCSQMGLPASNIDVQVNKTTISGNKAFSCNISANFPLPYFDKHVMPSLINLADKSVAMVVPNTSPGLLVDGMLNYVYDNDGILPIGTIEGIANSSINQTNVGLVVGALNSQATGTTIGIGNSHTSGTTLGAFNSNTSGNTTGVANANTSGNTTGAFNSNTSGNTSGLANANTNGNTTGAFNSNTSGNTSGLANSNTSGNTTGAFNSNTSGNTSGLANSNTSGNTTGAFNSNTSGNTSGSFNSNTSGNTTGAFDSNTTGNTTGNFINGNVGSGK